MTVTELLTRPKLTPISVPYDRDGSFNFPRGLGSQNPFVDGVRLHAGLRTLHSRKRRRSQINTAFLPILSAVEKVSVSLGAERLIPEVKVERSGIVGRVDLRAHGKSGIGHIEVKVVAALPPSPRERDLRQMSHYVALATNQPAWAAVIYVHLESGQARYFVFDSSISLLAQSAPLS